MNEFTSSNFYTQQPFQASQLFRNHLVVEAAYYKTLECIHK